MRSVLLILNSKPGCRTRSNVWLASRNAAVQFCLLSIDLVIMLISCHVTEYCTVELWSGSVEIQTGGQGSNLTGLSLYYLFLCCLCLCLKQIMVSRSRLKNSIGSKPPKSCLNRRLKLRLLLKQKFKTGNPTQICPFSLMN